MNKKMYIYRNLHKHCWSIRYGGKIIEHAFDVLISYPEFSVSKKGNSRVRLEKQKNVHAYIKALPNNVSTGTESTLAIPSSACRATYNPYLHETFVFKDSSEPVLSAKACWLLKDGRLMVLKEKTQEHCV